MPGPCLSKLLRFEDSGGISSQDLRADFGLWESESFAEDLEERFPWAQRLEKAFWRGHDWSSSNAFTELLPSRPRESCVRDAEPRAISIQVDYK